MRQRSASTQATAEWSWFDCECGSIANVVRLRAGPAGARGSAGEASGAAEMVPCGRGPRRRRPASSPPPAGTCGHGRARQATHVRPWDHRSRRGRAIRSSSGSEHAPSAGCWAAACRVCGYRGSVCRFLAHAPQDGGTTGVTRGLPPGREGKEGLVAGHSASRAGRRKRVSRRGESRSGAVHQRDVDGRERLAEEIAPHDAAAPRRRDRAQQCNSLHVH